MTLQTRLNIEYSRHHLEMLCTVILAYMVARWHTSAPIQMTMIVIGCILAIPILLKRHEYVVLMLVAIFPFRDVHLISIIHLKRLMIWGLLGYILIKNMTTLRPERFPPLSQFARAVLFFISALGIALLQTAAALQNSAYLTMDEFKTILFSDALIIVEQFVTVFIIYYSFRTFRQLQHILYLTIVIASFIALLGIWQYVNNGTPRLVAFLFDPDYLYYGRATAVFSNPNSLGIFLAPIVSGLILLCVLGTMTRKIRFGLFLPALLINSGGVLVSFSRTGIVQILLSLLVAGGIYWLKMCQRKISWKVVLIAVIMVGCIVGTIYYYEAFIQLRLGGSTLKNPQMAVYQVQQLGDAMRKYALATAFQLFSEHPFIGIGYGMIAKTRHLSLIWVENQYLKILAEMGIVGFIPFAALLGIILRTGISIWNRPPELRLADRQQLTVLVLLTAVMSYMAGNLFTDFLHILPVTGYMWIYSGMLFAIVSLSPVQKKAELKGI